MVKDSRSLNVINVRTMQSRVIVKTSNFNWDVIRTSMMDMEENRSTGNVTLYNLELESKLVNESTRVKEHTSTIKKFTINPQYLDNCFLWLMIKNLTKFALNFT